MTKFIGPRTGWEDHLQTTVHLEIDLETWASSGREKHTNATEQGAWLAQWIAAQLKQLEQAPDVAIHEVRFIPFAETTSPELPLSYEVGLLPS